MTFRIVSFWCGRCKAATPHEHDDTGKSYCVVCRERKTPRREPFRFVNDPGNTRAFISALDGMGNRGEQPRRKRESECSNKQDTD